MPSERLFRDEVLRTLGVEIYPFGRGYTAIDIESVGGIDVILLCDTVVGGSRFIPPEWGEYYKKSKALKVSIAPDFYEGSRKIKRYKRHYKEFECDIVFGYGTTVVKYLKEMNVGKWQYYLVHGVDTEVFKKCDVGKVIDVLATYTTKTRVPGIYVYREQIQEALTKMYVTSCVGIVPFNNLAEMTNRSKIVVNSNAKYNFLNPRITETLACGSFLLTSYCDDLVKFGYKDGEHLATFNNMEDFKDKVLYFLKHDKEREGIAENGMKFVRANYSNKNRVETMFDIISRHL